jgi:hypothetical protein
MARSEQDREDLLAEARALVERCELRCSGFEDNVVVGFRRDGCASVYVGQDRAYHFNTRRQLRRAYDGGRLIKADRGRLVSLVRHRTAHQVQLVRHELSQLETIAFLDRAWLDLQTLAKALADADFDLVGCVPTDADVVARAGQWLARLTRPIAVADRPEVR